MIIKKLIWTLLLVFLYEMPLCAQSPTGLISYKLVATNSADQINTFTQIPNYFEVKSYRISYYTNGVNGGMDTASGLVAVPIGTGCDSLPMLVYCHGTSLEKLNVPSFLNTIAPREFASAGFISVAPDYVGMGYSKGLHPYCIASYAASATINMIKAARQFLEEQGNQIVQNNGQVFITGYSEGGYTAMATLKYADKYGLNQNLGIKAGAPMSGPYNLSGVTLPPIILDHTSYAYFGYIAYIFMAYQEVYGNLFSNIHHFFKAPYDTLMLRWFNGEQNVYSISFVNSQLPNTINNFLIDTVLSNMQTNPNHAIWQDLKANDVFNWAPQIPIRIYYCKADDQVYYLNSVVAADSMRAQGAMDVTAVDVESNANHEECVAPAFTAMYHFFREKAHFCSNFPESIDRINTKSALALFPNPAKHAIHLQYDELHINDIQLITLEGQIIKVFPSQSKLLNVSGIPSGTYFIRIQAKEGDIVRLVVLE